MWKLLYSRILLYMYIRTDPFSQNISKYVKILKNVCKIRQKLTKVWEICVKVPLYYPNLTDVFILTNIGQFTGTCLFHTITNE